MTMSNRNSKTAQREKELTDNHGGELKTLPNAFSVDLVGQIGEPDVAHQFFADDGRETGAGRAICRAVERRGDVAIGSASVCVSHLVTKMRKYDNKLEKRS